MAFLNDGAQGGIFILHDNPEWIPPFAAAFERAGTPWHEWLLTHGAIDLGRQPPQGVFWSRISASSPSRGHGAAKEYGRAVIAWLESHGRRVINGGNVVEFEVSKVRQQLLLARAGFRTPRTIAAFSRGEVLQAARALPFPLMVKHNQGGKGIGVRRFASFAELQEHVLSNDWEESVDGITIVQEYVASAAAFITRLEFIGGRFHYAVRVDTSGGSFELCPADACALPDLAPAACEVPLPALAGAACEIAPPHAFTLRSDITASDPFVSRLEEFLRQHSIEVAGVEFLETAQGEKVIYDINTNTNYNSAVEEAAQDRATDAVVAFLQSQQNASN